MKKFSIFLMLLALCAAMAAPACADVLDDLWNRFIVNRVKPDSATLTLSAKPDATGFVERVYAELHGGSDFHGNRYSSSARVSMQGAQFNPTSEWKSDGDNIKLKSVKSIAATATVLEEDINKLIKGREFDVRDDTTHKKYIFHDVTATLTTDGVKLKGLFKEDENTGGLRSYAAAWLLGTAAVDYPIEIDTKLEVRNGKELWFKDPKVTGDYATINGIIEKEITKRTKPLAKLDDEAPLTFQQVEFANGSLTVSSTTLPESFEGAVKYTYGTTSGKRTFESSNFKKISEILQERLKGDAVKKAVNDKLGNLAETYPLKTEQPTSKESSVTDEELTAALGSEAGSTNKVFPTQTVDEDGTYPLGSVTLASYKVGTKVAIYMLTRTGTGGLSVAGVNVADDKLSDGAFLMDESGNIVSEVPEGGTVTAFAPMKADIEYTPVITVAEENGTLRSSGSGCYAGTGAITLALLAFAFFKKH